MRLQIHCKLAQVLGQLRRQQERGGRLPAGPRLVGAGCRRCNRGRNARLLRAALCYEHCHALAVDIVSCAFNNPAGDFWQFREGFPMAEEASAIEKAVSRALRENLATLRRTAAELNQAIEDVVSACSSTRSTNVLPPMLRAQAAAASLEAMLEVLSRFIAAVLQRHGASAEEAILRAVSLPAPEPAPTPRMPPPSIPVPMAEEQVVEAGVPERVAPEPAPVEEARVEAAPPAAEAPPFDVKNLSSEEQELHRKANRHAKVSMQDIKLIRPEQLRLGCQNKDICVRLRDDIDKARKEYDRRFKAILNQPVDYFYDWMVQVLADGDPEKLGEYPYPSPVHRRH